MNIRLCRAWVIGAACAIAPMPTLTPFAAAVESERGFRVPVQLFAGEPRGPYRTGTFEEMWVNEALDDPSTAAAGDPRKLMVQVWYPAKPPKNPRYAPYAISPNLYGRDSWLDSAYMDEQVRNGLEQARTRSMLDAPVAAGPGRWPVLIYSHGNGHPHFSGTSQTEFLASHGYVVVAIGHTGANGLERFLDGTPYRHDGLYQWDVEEVPEHEKTSVRDDAEYRLKHADLGLFVGDIGFVLDRLAALDSDPGHRFYRRLDLDRVGSLGWSLGGFTSLQAARDEPRIKAAANLDGWPYGLSGPGGAVTLGSRRPVLLMFGDYGPPDGGEVDAAEVERHRVVYTYYWTMLRRSSAGWYYMDVARTSHGHFSDMSLFETADPQALRPREAHAIVNGYLLEFFDKYVRGGDVDTPLLSGRQGFPGVRLWRKKGADATGKQEPSAGD